MSSSTSSESIFTTVAGDEVAVVERDDRRVDRVRERLPSRSSTTISVSSGSCVLRLAGVVLGRGGLRRWRSRRCRCGCGGRVRFLVRHSGFLLCSGRGASTVGRCGRAHRRSGGAARARLQVAVSGPKAATFTGRWASSRCSGASSDGARARVAPGVDPVDGVDDRGPRVRASSRELTRREAGRPEIELAAPRPPGRAPSPARGCTPVSASKVSAGLEVPHDEVRREGARPRAGRPGGSAAASRRDHVELPLAAAQQAEPALAEADDGVDTRSSSSAGGPRDGRPRS